LQLNALSLQKLNFNINENKIIFLVRSHHVYYLHGITAHANVATATNDTINEDGSGEWVCINGEWVPVEKTFILTQTYYMISDQTLHLQNLRPQRVVTVSILNDADETVYETETSGTTTLLLSLDNLPAGDYRLELRDVWGSYLYADFAKE
jgi:hypothetical protein